MFDPAHGGRAGRRLRPAVPRRRLDRALVLARLREPDDRHELGRRVRRRLRQGRQGLRRPRRLRRGGQERHRGAAGRRPERPERRPQGPPDRRCSSATRRRRVRGRLVGARGLHQRLRHRATWRRRWPAERSGRRQAARCREEPEYFLSRATQLREHVRPGDRLLPGPHAPAGAGSPRPTSTTRGCGATSTTTRRPTAGTSRSTCRRTARGSPTSTAAGTRSRASSTRSSPRRRPATFTGSYGGTIHEMLEARDVRMGQWGFSNQVSHHIPWMYAYARQPWKTAGEDARGAAPPVRRLGDRPGLRGRRGQRRDVGLVPVRALRACTRCRWGARTTSSARRCSRS